MATGYDDSVWGRGADEESPLTGLGTTFASAPDDQIDALFNKLQEVSGKKPPKLNELSRGDRIAAAFGTIGTTMQRMAGRNVPSYADTLMQRKRQEYEDEQQGILKTLGLKIQVAKMRGGQDAARQKLMAEAIPKVMEVFGKLNDMNAGPEAYRAAIAGMNKAYPGMVPPELGEGIITGESGLRDLQQAYAAKILTDPKDIVDYMKIWGANRKTPKVADEWLTTRAHEIIGEEVNRRMATQAGGPTPITREETIRQAFEDVPKRLPFAKGFPGYKERAEKDITPGSPVETQIFNDLVKEYGGDRKKAREALAKWQRSSSKGWMNQMLAEAEAENPDNPEAAFQSFLEKIGRQAFVQSQQRTVGAKTGPARTATVETAGEVGEAGAAGAKIGANRAVQDLPLDAKAPNWINPKTLVPATGEMTPNSAKAAGFVPVSQSGLGAVGTARAAMTQLKEYRELSEKLLVSGKGDIGDLFKVQGNRVRLSVLRGMGDPDAKRLDGLFGAIATLARATGDTANIAVQEREFLKNFVVTESDTIESAKAKLDQAERILTGVISGRVPGYTSPDAPMDDRPPSVTPKATKRYNPKTGRIEVIP